MTLSDVFSRLHNCCGHNGRYMARCPAHDDQYRSLSVAEGDDGRIFLYCHAGCSVGSIIAALNGGEQSNDLT